MTCFSILLAGQPGIRLASEGGGGLSPTWPATRRIYSGELWDRWPAGGLCSRADRISSSDPRGLNWSVSRHARTHSHTPTRSCVCIWTDSCLTSTTSHISATERHPSFIFSSALFFSLSSCCFFFLALLQASSDFLLTAAWSDCRDIAGVKRLISLGETQTHPHPVSGR